MAQDKQVECPRAKSATTPCYLRDGDLVVVQNSFRKDICVGCEVSISQIEGKEEQP